jgi:prophage antirepressor-like protein
VRGYVDENGMAWLNAEDVARGFGFVHKETKNGKTYETIRWSTVNGYLKEFGFRQDVGEDSRQVGKDDFLPENMVYRLGFKASNETAQAFQAELADEILPTIRKTGSYNAKPMTTGELLMQHAQAYLEHERRMAQIEVTQKEQEQRLLEVESKQMTIDKNFYTIAGYANLKGFKGISRKLASDIGRKASGLSRRRGYEIGNEYDARYGKVHTYHEDMLKEVFSEMFE